MDRNLLADATSGDDSPTPGYQLNEIARSTVANYQACTQIQEYLVNRISKNNPHIKFKCLVIIKHICRSGRVDFKRDMAKHIEVIKECLQYRGAPDPLRGDEYYRRVREAAKEALEAIYDSAVPVSTSAVAAANRIQGLGGGEQVISQKQAPSGILGSVTSVIQNLAIEKDSGYVGHPGATGIFTGNNPTVYSNNINTNQNTYTGPNTSNTIVTTTATGMVGIGNPNFKDSREEKSWYQRASEATKQVANIAITSANSISTNKSNNSLIQTGNPSNQTDYSNTYMSNRGSNAINQSEVYKPTVSIVPDIPTNPNGVGRVGSALSDGSYERLQLLSLCDPAGLKPVPNDELLSKFLSTVSTLSSDIIGNCLLDILNNDAWQSRNKGLVVISGICSNNNNISHIDWWKNNGLDTLLDISSRDSKATVRSQANKTLRVLGVNTNGSLPISPVSSSNPISPNSTRNAFSSESLIETDLLGDINSSYLPPPPIPPKPPVSESNDIFAGLSIGSGGNNISTSNQTTNQIQTFEFLDNTLVNHSNNFNDISILAPISQPPAPPVPTANKKDLLSDAFDFLDINDKPIDIETNNIFNSLNVNTSSKSINGSTSIPINPLLNQLQPINNQQTNGYNNNSDYLNILSNNNDNNNATIQPSNYLYQQPVSSIQLNAPRTNNNFAANPVMNINLATKKVIPENSQSSSSSSFSFINSSTTNKPANSLDSFGFVTDAMKAEKK